MSIKETVRTNIRALRQEAGLSQQKLAERADRSLSYINYVENNDSDITLTTLERFALALGVPVAKIVTASDPEIDRPPIEARAGLEYVSRMVNAKLAALAPTEGSQKRKPGRKKKTTTSRKK